jgi:hypothetical protein
MATSGLAVKVLLPLLAPNSWALSLAEWLWPVTAANPEATSV